MEDQVFEGIHIDLKSHRFNGSDHHNVVIWDDQNCVADRVGLLEGDDSMPNYEVGDLVWAKVKSHPWWPAQVFDATHASAKAKSMRKRGRILVAFYGDHTFAWLERAQILEFKSNFKEKVKVAATKSFQYAVSEVLNEVCRRAQLGLQCGCRKSSLGNGCTLGDVEDGVEVAHEGFRLHKDVSIGKEILDSRRSLSFLKDLACSPCKSFNSSMEASVLHGQVLGLRTGFFADIGKDETLDFRSECPTHEGAFQSGSETCTDDDKDATVDIRETQSEVECRKRGNAAYEESIFPLEHRRAKRHHVEGSKVDCEDSLAKTYRVSNIHTESLLTSEGPHFELPNLTGGAGHEGVNDVLMQISEALRQFLAIDPLCSHNSYNTMVRVVPVFLKFRDFVFQKSAGYGTHLRTPGQEEMQMTNAHAIGSGTGNDSPNPVAKAVQYWRPMSLKYQKYRSSDHSRDNEVESLGILNNYVKLTTTPAEQCTAPTNVSHEGNKLSSAREWEKTDVILGRSPEQVSQAQSGAQKMVFSQKLDVHELLLAAQRKKSEFSKEAPVKPRDKAVEISAFGSKAVSDVHTDVQVKAKQKFETKPTREPLEELPGDASRVLDSAGHVFPEVSADARESAELAFKTRIDLGVFAEQFSKSAPDIEVSTELCAITKPEDNFEGHCVGNMESSTPIPDGASLHQFGFS